MRGHSPVLSLSHSIQRGIKFVEIQAVYNVMIDETYQMRCTAITLHSKLELVREKAGIYEIPVTFPCLMKLEV